MKILKPGKVKMRKFVCPKCGCVFVSRETEIDIGIDRYVCPQGGCRYCGIGWEDGEPYEEPTQGKDSDRLNELIRAMPEFMTSSKAAEFLIGHGVTFREE